MLKRDTEIPRVGRFDALVITANVAANEVRDDRCHHLLCDDQTFLQIDAVAFGFEAGEKRILERFQFRCVPRFQAANEVFGYAVCPAH